MEIKRMEIFRVNLSGGVGREENKIRPCLVVSNDIGNKCSDIITIIPITSTKRMLPTHVWIEKDEVNGLLNDSMIIAEQLRTIDKSRIIDYVGCIDSSIIEEKINNAIRIALCA